MIYEINKYKGGKGKRRKGGRKEGRKEQREEGRKKGRQEIREGGRDRERGRKKERKKIKEKKRKGKYKIGLEGPKSVTNPENTEDCGPYSYGIIARKILPI